MLCVLCIEPDQHLPPITAREVQWALSKFSRSTAVGADHWKPHELLYLSTTGIHILTCIVNLAERAGYPLGDLVDVVFLDKSGGGESPIGLLCALYRVWWRCRRKYARAWERHFTRKYFWASEGKSSEDAVHHQESRSSSHELGRNSARASSRT